MIRQLWAWLRGEEKTIVMVNHVDMFESAKTHCNNCSGTGWFPEYVTQKMCRCWCVDNDDAAAGHP